MMPCRRIDNRVSHRQLMPRYVRRQQRDGVVQRYDQALLRVGNEMDIWNLLDSVAVAGIFYFRIDRSLSGKNIPIAGAYQSPTMPLRLITAPQRG